MKKGDKFTWLYSESDPHFGLECEVLEVRKTLVDYKFIHRPNWSSCTMPLEWAVPKKHYSPEEISEIQKRQRRRRLAEKF